MFAGLTTEQSTLLLGGMVILGGLITGYLTNLATAKALVIAANVRKSEKNEEWERQDKVAAAAEVAAEKLANRQDAAEARAVEVVDQAKEAARLNEERQDRLENQTAQAARLLVINNEAVHEASVATQEKLEVIHTLVNDKLTAAMKGRLASDVLALVTLRRVAELTKEDQRVIAVLNSDITELQDELAARAEAQAIVDKQITTQK